MHFSLLLLQATRTETRFEWGHLPPLWVVFLVIVPAIVFVVSAIYRRERVSAGSWVRWILGGLRVVLILAILLFLAQPILRTVTYQTRDPHLLILVDDSLSMGIVDKYSDREIPRRLAEMLRTSPEVVEELSRYGLVKRLVEDTELGVLERLRAEMKVSVYTFAGSTRKVMELNRDSAAASAENASTRSLPESEITQGDERVKQTRIGDSVLEALSDAQGSGFLSLDDSVAGVLLLTDGQNNSGVLQPEEMARRLKQRGVPLWVVGVGNPDLPKNIRVVNVDVNDVVLVGDQVPIDATLVTDGFRGDSVQVDLLFDGDVVATEYVMLEGEGKKQLVRLQHRPRRPGDFTVSVQVEKMGGELFWDDNIFSRPIRVMDEKIRVLYVEGRPRYEYRYLKNALIRDPTMEAHILLLSADREFIQEASPGLAPLLRFPSTREELFKYHVVLIGDVGPHDQDASGRPFGEHLELIREFVGDSGGGVVFISGQESNPRKYVRTPLDPLLPVEVPETGGGLGGDRVITAPFSVALTSAGKEHAVMRLDSSLEQSAELWQNEDGIEENHLPGFYWFAEVSKLKLAGIALAVHPVAEDPIHRNRRVIMAVQNYGKGRCFFSAVDEIWRWRAGVGSVYVYRFWGQVIRFAASGRLLGQTPRFSIATDKRVYTIGENVAIDAKVYDASMEPSKEPKVSVFHAIKGRDLESPRRVELDLNPAREGGAYEGRLAAGQLGSHDLWLGTETEKLASTTFTVEVPPVEFRNTQLDAARLKKVASLCEGKYYELHELMTVVDDLGGRAEPRQIPIEDVPNDLWDESWVLFLFTGLIAAEWILRKAVKLL